MWLPRRIAATQFAATLSLVLLLASTAGELAHDHATGARAGVAACRIDHHDRTATSAHDSAPAVHKSGKPHEHDCLACHLARHRLALAERLDTDTAANLAFETAPRPVAPTWVGFDRTGGTRRGPPRA